MIYKQEEIEYWAQHKGIYDDGGSFMAQAKGMAEEVVEVTEAWSDALYINSPASDRNLQRELGDVYVFWINACRIAGVNPSDCIDAAFRKINGRDGKMVDGRFVKEVIE